MSLRDEARYRVKVGKTATMIRGILRRLTVTLTENALWQLAGAVDETEKEVEVFSGIGFYSRPPTTGTDPEVIRALIGGKTAHPVIIALRDETVRQTLLAIRNMKPNEAAMFTKDARVHILDDGTVEVDDGSGAVALALKSDVDTIQGELDGHDHTYQLPIHTAVTAQTTANPSVTAPAGTTILKGK